jgi:hypothetical protein
VWKRLSLFGHFGYIEIIRFLMVIFSRACYTPVHNFDLFMVVFTTCEESRPIYGGVYPVGRHGGG